MDLRTKRLRLPGGNNKSLLLSKLAASEKTSKKMSTAKENGKRREKKFKCHICGFACFIASNLKRHSIKHSTVRCFQCRFCNHVSKTKDNLKAHERTHDSSKPFSCHLCDCSFTRSASLKQHLILHAAKREQYLKPCTFENCNYKTIHQSCLLNHMKKTHSDEKPFKCTDCEYACKYSRSLKLHQIIHVDSKYKELLSKQCTYGNCRYKSPYSSSLRRHMRTHSNEKPIQCNVCEMSFKQKRYMKQHAVSCIGKKKKYKSCFVFNCSYRTVSLRMLNRHLKTHDKKFKTEYTSDNTQEESEGTICIDTKSVMSPMVPEIVMESSVSTSSIHSSSISRNSSVSPLVNMMLQAQKTRKCPMTRSMTRTMKINTVSPTKQSITTSTSPPQLSYLLPVTKATPVNPKEPTKTENPGSPTEHKTSISRDSKMSATPPPKLLYSLPVTIAAPMNSMGPSVMENPGLSMEHSTSVSMDSKMSATPPPQLLYSLPVTIAAPVNTKEPSIMENPGSSAEHSPSISMDSEMSPNASTPWNWLDEDISKKYYHFNQCLRIETPEVSMHVEDIDVAMNVEINSQRDSPLVDPVMDNLIDCNTMEVLDLSLKMTYEETRIGLMVSQLRNNVANVLRCQMEPLDLSLKTASGTEGNDLGANKYQFERDHYETNQMSRRSEVSSSGVVEDDFVEPSGIDLSARVETCVSSHEPLGLVEFSMQVSKCQQSATDFFEENCPKESRLKVAEVESDVSHLLNYQPCSQNAFICKFCTYQNENNKVIALHNDVVHGFPVVALKLLPPVRPIRKNLIALE